VKIAEEEGWGQMANGDLISRAEESGYQILLTCDQNVRYRQNLTRRKISMVCSGLERLARRSAQNRRDHTSFEEIRARFFRVHRDCSCAETAADLN